MEYSDIFKILLVGDSGTGKSSLMKRYCDDIFSESYISTIGVDFKIKEYTKNNKTYKIQIWDTAGQERFRTITRTYFRGAQCCLIFFDITNSLSFQNISYWIEESIQNCQKVPLLVLVGTKKDIINRREVPKEVIENFIKERKMMYFEISSKDGENIDKLFDYVIETLANNPIKNNQNKTIKPKVITNNRNNITNNKCCN
jgi:small GTP-binding protein